MRGSGSTTVLKERAVKLTTSEANEEATSEASERVLALDSSERMCINVVRSGKVGECKNVTFRAASDKKGIRSQERTFHYDCH